MSDATIGKLVKVFSLINPSTIVWALAGGFLAAFVWLWFWLKEDEHPEPRRLLIIAFLSGIIAIPAALGAELAWCALATSFKFVPSCSVPPNTSFDVLASFLPLLAGYAFIEEYAKYFFVHLLIFWRRDYDEPADAMIYLITAALGFAAVENALYLVGPFNNALFYGFTSSNLRFLGPTLLHALSSGLLGYFIAKAFFRNWISKDLELLLGLFFATILHLAFNFLILMTKGKSIEPALVLLALAGIVILFSFERIKHTIKKYYA